MQNTNCAHLRLLSPAHDIDILKQSLIVQQELGGIPLQEQQRITSTRNSCLPEIYQKSNLPSNGMPILKICEPQLFQKNLKKI